jgi:hypothetical protein
LRGEEVNALDDHPIGVSDALDFRLPPVRDEIVDRLVEGLAALGERKVFGAAVRALSRSGDRNCKRRWIEIRHGVDEQR